MKWGGKEPGENDFTVCEIKTIISVDFFNFYFLNKAINNVKKLHIDILFTCYQGRKEMFYLTKHSTHFIYGYMASDIW